MSELWNHRLQYSGFVRRFAVCLHLSVDVYKEAKLLGVNLSKPANSSCVKLFALRRAVSGA